MQQGDDGDLLANPGPTPSRNSSSEPPPAWAWSEDERRGSVIMSVSTAVVWEWGCEAGFGSVEIAG